MCQKNSIAAKHGVGCSNSMASVCYTECPNPAHAHAYSSVCWVHRFSAWGGANKRVQRSNLDGKYVVRVVRVLKRRGGVN